MVRNYKRKTEDRWSKEDLLEALCCIKDSKLKINDAARQYGISRATLYRQYQKFILAGGKCDVNQFRTCGGNPILTKVEEDVLEKTIRDLREQGFTVTSSDIKRICFEYCDSNGIPNQFNQDKRMASDDWYYGFLKRHPDVRISKPGGSSPTSTTAAPTSSSSLLQATTSSPEKSPKSKKLKLSPTKKMLKLDKISAKSPVVNFVSPHPASRVTSPKKEKQVIHATPTPVPTKGRKPKQGQTGASPPAGVKKPLKRLNSAKPSSGGGGGRRGRKPKAKSILPNIPDTDDELVKEELDDSDAEDDDEPEPLEAMEVGNEEDDENDDDEEEEEQEDEEEEDDDDEDKGDENEVEDEEEEEIEMDEEEPAEKSESEEEEEEEDAEEDGEDEEEENDEQEDQEVDEDGDNAEVEEGDEVEEGEEEEDEDEEADEEDEDEDEDDDDDAVVKTEKDDESGSDDECPNDEELLEKLLDM